MSPAINPAIPLKRVLQSVKTFSLVQRWKNALKRIKTVTRQTILTDSFQFYKKNFLHDFTIETFKSSDWTIRLNQLWPFQHVFL